YEHVLMRRRASRWVDPALADSAGPATGHISFRETSRTKLGHDLQQYRHLLRLELLSAEFNDIVAVYESVLAEIGNRPIVALTVWFDYGNPEGYVGAMLVDGFACPLLLRIAEELPMRLPTLFGEEKLVQAWAFKYESNNTGIALHADAARLNVNFWITPDEAN